MQAEARTISHLEKRYKGLENKIIELQQKYDVINKENGVLKVQVQEIPEWRRKIEYLRNVENELRTVKAQLSEKEDRIIHVQKQLDLERDEKVSLLDEKNKEEEEFLTEKSHWQIEKQELKQQIQEMLEISKNDKKIRLSEVETNEMNLAYHKAVKDKDTLENENVLLRQEMKRLQLIISNPNDLESNRNSILFLSATDEDFGYSSSRNTLEKPLKKSGASSQLSNEGDLNSKNTSGHFNFNFSAERATSTPNNSPIHQDSTVVMLRLRKLLEEEKNRGESLRREVMRLKNKNSLSFNTEDSLKVSELEVENEKLRQDYLLLRNSIDRGVEQQELEAQYNALQEELKRRREECIQLRGVLAQQSQTLRSFAGQDLRAEANGRNLDGSELLEAFQAQKLANRQLESELTAITEEHNMKFKEMSQQIDNLRNEKCALESIIQDKLDVDLDGDATTVKQKESYLRMELDRAAVAYVELQEQMNEQTRKINELIKKNNILSNRLREHGLNDSIILNDPNTNNIASVKKKALQYQGILKYQYQDEQKILQRIITDLKPRVAITLLPGLPSYIIFMCIRYTDLLNADQQVKTLLTNFVLMVKKLFKLPNAPDSRILWIVNAIT